MAEIDPSQEERNPGQATKLRAKKKRKLLEKSPRKSKMAKLKLARKPRRKRRKKSVTVATRQTAAAARRVRQMMIAAVAARQSAAVTARSRRRPQTRKGREESRTKKIPFGKD